MLLGILGLSLIIIGAIFCVFEYKFTTELPILEIMVFVIMIGGIILIAFIDINADIIYQWFRL